MRSSRLERLVVIVIEQMEPRLGSLYNVTWIMSVNMGAALGWNIGKPHLT